MLHVIEYVNIITGRDKAKKDSELLRKPGSADRLNSFYARFDDKDFSDEYSALRNDLQGRMKEPITVDTSEVIKVVNKLNVNKACGPDKISAFTIKKCLSSLLWIIHKLFEISASECKMPRPWKLGEIIPINKKTLPKVDNDLRPVTLTAILSKCFEQVILPKLKFFVMPLIDTAICLPGKTKI